MKAQLMLKVKTFCKMPKTHFVASFYLATAAPEKHRKSLQHQAPLASAGLVFHRVQIWVEWWNFLSQNRDHLTKAHTNKRGSPNSNLPCTRLCAAVCLIGTLWQLIEILATVQILLLLDNKSIFTTIFWTRRMTSQKKRTAVLRCTSVWKHSVKPKAQRFLCSSGVVVIRYFPTK